MTNKDKVKIVEELATDLCDKALITLAIDEPLEDNPELFRTFQISRAKAESVLLKHLTDTALQCADRRAKLKAIDIIQRRALDRPEYGMLSSSRTIQERFNAVMDAYDQGRISSDSLTIISNALKVQAETLLKLSENFEIKEAIERLSEKVLKLGGSNG